MRIVALVLGASSLAATIAACGSADRASLSHLPAKTGGSTSSGGADQGGSGGMGVSGSGTGGSLGGGGSGSETGGSGGGSGGTIDSCPSDTTPAPQGTFECATDIAFGNPMETTIPLDGGRLLAASSDELAFVTARFGSSAEEFAFVERADTSSDFGVPVQLLGAERPVGLSPDGLSLVVLDSSSQILSERTRSAPFEDFGAPDDTVFDKLNDDAIGNGYTFREVVLSTDGKTLFYSASNVGSEFGVFQSVRSGNGPWPIGVALPSCEFGQKQGLRRKPLALSGDTLTLFYFDEVRSRVRAAYRESPGSDFTFFVDFVGTSWFSPNAACDAAYLVASGTTVRATKVVP